MSERVVVPEGMKQAVVDAFRQAADAGQDCGFNAILEAALLWLDRELDKLMPPEATGWTSEETKAAFFVDAGRRKAIEAVRRMSRAPEPEVPEAVKDLLWNNPPSNSGRRGSTVVEEAERRIIEAYRRGLREK